MDTHDTVYWLGAAGGDGTSTTLQLAARRIAERGGTAIIVDPRGDVELGRYNPVRNSPFDAAAEAMTRQWPLHEVIDRHSHDIAPGVKMISGRTDLASISRSTASRLPDSHVLKSVADAAAAGGAAVLVDLGTVRTAAALGWLGIAPAPQRVLVSTNRFPSRLRAHALLDDRQAALSVQVVDRALEASRGSIEIACGRRADVRIDMRDEIALLADSHGLLHVRTDAAAALDTVIDRAGLIVGDDQRPEITLG